MGTSLCVGRLEERIAPATLTAAIVGNDLVITDTMGVNNFLLVALNGSNYDITDGVEHFQTVPAPPGTLSNNDQTVSVSTTSFSGKIIFNTVGGDDFLTVYSITNISRNIDFNGGAGGFDKMGMKGGNFTSVTHTPINANDGSIYYVPAGVDPPWTLTYTGLEPVSLAGSTINDLVLNMPPAASDAFLEDAGVNGDGQSQLRSNNVTFETTVFSNPVNSLTINRGNASDSITVSALPDFNRTLKIGASTAPFGPMTFSGAVTLASGYSLAAFGSSTVNFSTSSSDVATSGSGSIGLTTEQNISLGNLSSITSGNGAISLSANQQVTPTSGNYVGIEVSGATISSGGGNVTLLGRGGTSGSFENVGVRVQDGSQIVAGGAGTVLIEGTGGTASHKNYGTQVRGNAQITSAGGAVTVKGTGGTLGTFNHGVIVESGGTITSGGMGLVTVEGHGGVSTLNDNRGVWVSGSNSNITSSGGNVQVKGFGGGTATSVNNFGVSLDSDGVITAGGMGSVTVEGTGGGGTGGSNYGVSIVYTGGKITSGGGNVSVTGIEGSGSNSRAIEVFTPGMITTAANGGQITLVGNSMNVAGTVSANSSSTVTLRPYTNTTAIDLGSASDPIGGPLSLTDAELDLVTAGLVQIGDANSGTITVSAAITHGNHLSLVTGAGITANDAITMAANKYLIGSAIGTINLATANADFAASGSGTIGMTTKGSIAVAAGGSMATTSGVITLGADSDNDGVGSLTLAAGFSAWTQQAQLLASDGAINDLFGYWGSISADGNTAIVGAADDLVGLNSFQGSAYIFVRTGSVWSQQAKLVAPAGAADDLFGCTVAVSADGNTAIVGAEKDDVGANGDQGSAFVFTRSGTIWTLQQQIFATGGVAGDRFGFMVDISDDGNTAVVGAKNDTVGGNAFQGSAYVFTRSGTVWTQQAQLTASDGAANDLFGYWLTISGDSNTVLVGVYVDTVGANVAQGSAYVYTRSGIVWTEQAHLFASDGAAGDQFGSDVALSTDGNTAVIGAYYDNVGANNDQGSAYVFTRSGTVWTEQQRLTSSDGSAGDAFGSGVGLSGDGNTAYVGAFFDTVSAAYQGSAYIFTRSGGVWTQQQQTVASDAGVNDLFGSPVRLSADGKTAFSAAAYADVGATDQGSAYIFTLNTTPAAAISSGAGIITVTAADADIQGTISNNTTVTFVPTQTNRPIDLGTNTLGSLSLTDAELDNITAGAILNIGNAISGTITVSAAITHGNNVLLTTGAGITANSSFTLAANKNLTASAISTINFANTNADFAASGTGSIGLTTPRNIVMSSGSSIVTVAGNISLSANMQFPATSGSFIGIDVNGGTIGSTSGAITIQGRGGNSGASQLGVRIQANSTVGSGTGGAVTVEGTGGLSSGAGSYGVSVVGANAVITSGGGAVSVTGTGGNGSSADNYGVNVESAGQITAGGAGTVNVFGIGGNGISGSSNYAIRVYGNATIDSAGGSVALTTTAGSGSSFSIVMDSNATVASGGNGSLTINTDSLNVADNLSTLRAGAAGNQTLFVRIRTIATNIALGGSDGLASFPYTLGLTDPELDRMFAAKLDMGNTSTGVISTSAAITRTTSTDLLLTSGVSMGLGAGLDSAGGSINLVSYGAITQTAGTIQAGGGTLTLNAINQKTTINTLGNKAAQVVIPSGSTCIINGSFDASGAVQVDGTLMGNSGSMGTLTVTGTGKVAPGLSPGLLNTGSVAFNSGSKYDVELNGSSPGTGYDQLAVTGTVNLGNASLTVSLGFAPANGQVFKIIDNDGSGDAVTSTFNGLPEGSTYGVGQTTYKVSYVGGDGNDVTLTAQVVLPTVTGVTFGDGTNQRSTVRQIVVNFSEAVNFSPSVVSAFTLYRKGNSAINGNPLGNVALTTNPVSGSASSVTITFSGAYTESNNSLIDGLYDFTIDATKVSGVNGALDGDFNATAGGDYVVIGTTPNRYYRLFGDSDGDGTVNQTDYNAFRLAFLGGPSTVFDFDNDGQVSQSDYNAFRLRFLGAP